MKKKYNLLTLPREMTLFIDNSCFQLNDYNRIYKCVDMKHPSTDYLKADYSRFIKLTKKFHEMENWMTTRNVVTEFRQGNTVLKGRARATPCKQVSKIYKRHFRQRKSFLRLLEDNHRLADCNLNTGLIRIINNNNKLIERVFGVTDYICNNKKTDIELINFTLAYAIQDPPSCIFSHDLHLLRTFIRCSEKLNLINETYCLTDSLGKPIKTKDIRTNYFN